MLQEEKEIILWYLECKNTLNKVTTLYREYLNIGFQDNAYKELNENYNHSLKELKNLVK